MTALSADARRAKYNLEHARKTPYLMAASTTIYANGLVAVNASGLAVPAADTANLKVVGIAAAGVTSAASGSYYVEVYAGVEADFASSGLDQTDVGKVCVVTDDNTVTDAATATNDISVGVVTRFTGSTATVLVAGGFAYGAA